MTGKAINYGKIEFVKSVYQLAQLPEEQLPEIAFAGRSNVGKSSLINRLVNRKGLVKVSARPGKTQSLNFFKVDSRLHLVDLPGYGFARVDKKLRDDWQALISEYLEKSPNLCAVVVLIDLRHPLKEQDRELAAWLAGKHLPFFIVYTKKDKLSKNDQAKQTASLDAALGLDRAGRVLFSAKTGEGKDELIAALAAFLDQQV